MYSKIFKKPKVNGKNFGKSSGKNFKNKLLLGTGAAITAAVTLSRLGAKSEPEIEFPSNMFNFFSNPKDYSSVIFTNPKAPKHVFRGGMEEFIEKHSQSNNITSIMICGKKIGEGIYDSSLTLDSELLKSFLELIDKEGIKELNFEGCTLNSGSGYVLGKALTTNKSLEDLSVTSNQLKPNGMIAILEGLKHNQSVKIFNARSYNVDTYYWSHEELKKLAEVVSENHTLEKILLSNNQIKDFSDINILLEPYENNNSNRTLPEISGLEVSDSCRLPSFCKANLEDLEQLSKHKFSNQF